MSDTMLLGVLRMPMDNPTPLQLAQFITRARQAASQIEADAKEIEWLKAKLAETESQLREMSRLVIRTAELEAALARDMTRRQRKRPEPPSPGSRGKG